MTDTATQVREAIRFNTDAELVEDGMHLSSDLGLDSLDMVEIGQRIEDRLSIDIIDFDLWYEAKTVGDLINLVEEKVAARAAA